MEKKLYRVQFNLHESTTHLTKTKNIIMQQNCILDELGNYSTADCVHNRKLADW